MQDSLMFMNQAQQWPKRPTRALMEDPLMYPVPPGVPRPPVVAHQAAVPRVVAEVPVAVVEVGAAVVDVAVARCRSQCGE